MPLTLFTTVRRCGCLSRMTCATCVCVRACVRACVCACMRACVRACRRGYGVPATPMARQCRHEHRTCTTRDTRTRARAHTHTHMHTRAHTARTHTHAHSARAHTHTHAHARAHTHTHTRTHTHARTRLPNRVLEGLVLLSQVQVRDVTDRFKRRRDLDALRQQPLCAACVCVCVCMCVLSCVGVIACVHAWWVHVSASLSFARARIQARGEGGADAARLHAWHRPARCSTHTHTRTHPQHVVRRPVPVV